MTSALTASQESAKSTAQGSDAYWDRTWGEDPASQVTVSVKGEKELFFSSGINGVLYLASIWRHQDKVSLILFYV